MSGPPDPAYVAGLAEARIRAWMGVPSLSRGGLSRGTRHAPWNCSIASLSSGRPAKRVTESGKRKRVSFSATITLADRLKVA